MSRTSFYPTNHLKQTRCNSALPAMSKDETGLDTTDVDAIKIGTPTKPTWSTKPSLSLSQN